jgi:hypothetical protein
MPEDADDSVSSDPSGEQVFRARLSRVLATHWPVVAVVVPYAVFTWLTLGRVSEMLPALLIVIVAPLAYWQYRNTYVAIGPQGLRIKSPWSMERDPKVFAWSEITDAVVTRTKSGSRATVEIRSGSRFGWIKLTSGYWRVALIRSAMRCTTSTSIALACILPSMK